MLNFPCTKIVRCNQFPDVLCERYRVTTVYSMCVPKQQGLNSYSNLKAKTPMTHSIAMNGGCSDVQPILSATVKRLTVCEPPVHGQCDCCFVINIILC